MLTLLLAASKVTAILCAGTVTFLLVRTKAASARHAVLAVTFLLCPVVLLVGPAVPNWQIPVATDRPAIVGPAALEAAALPAAQPTIDPWAVGFGLWAGIATLLLLRIGAAVLIAAVRRKSEPSRELQFEALSAARSLGVTQPVSLKIGQVPCPLTYGLFRHSVVVPPDFADWPLERRTSVFRHEAAHMKRFDCAWTIFANVVCAVLWCHPLVWLLARAMRNEAELAADERVVASGVSATDYADHLVAIARLLNKPRGLVRSHGVTIMSNNNLETRVRRVLGGKRSGVTTVGSLSLVLVSALATVMVAGANLRPQDQEPQATTIETAAQDAAPASAPVAAGGPAEGAAAPIAVAQASAQDRKVAKAELAVARARKRLADAEGRLAAVRGRSLRSARAPRASRGQAVTVPMEAPVAPQAGGAVELPATTAAPAGVPSAGGWATGAAAAPLGTAVEQPAQPGKAQTAAPGRPVRATYTVRPVVTGQLGGASPRVVRTPRAQLGGQVVVAPQVAAPMERGRTQVTLSPAGQVAIARSAGSAPRYVTTTARGAQVAGTATIVRSQNLAPRYTTRVRLTGEAKLARAPKGARRNVRIERSATARPSSDETPASIAPLDRP
ncbi:MAG: hypothetical protein JSS66_15070 [Armatimonadetes bacterium]|nr:hypothetical protein [Armatimonadota bacterium]